MDEARFEAKVYWARELPPDERERARRGVTLRRFGPGETLIHRGDKIDAWIGVMDGLLQLGSVTSSGKAVTYAGLPSSAWFGEGSLLKDEPRQYDVTALRAAEAAYLNRAAFMWLYENSMAFNRLLVRLLNARLGQFIASIEHDRTLDGTGKVARSLAWLFNPTISPFLGDRLEINQEEIAALAGVSRPTANKALRDLEAEGVIRNERGGLRVLDWAGLRHYNS